MHLTEGPTGEFGPELRRRRIAAALTLTQFAELTSYSKGHLSKIERGHKTAPPGFARRCDVLLHADGELERLATRPRPAPASGVEPPPRLDRRQLLAAGAGSLLGAAHLATAKAFGTKAADTSLAPTEIFRSQFDQMRQLGQTTDPGVLLPVLSAQTHAIRQLALQARAAEQARLFVLAAHYAEYAGWMAQEAGDTPGALRWTARAVDLAETGGDRDLASYALVRRALITFYAGEAAETVQLVEAAQAGRLPPRIRGLAAQREAQGHALAGDRDACLRSLDRARELLAAAAAESDGSSPVLGTTTVADPAAMVTGWCLYDLGRPGQAAEVLDREHPGIPPHALRSRARYGLRRALAHAASGEPQHACELAAELLPFVPALRSATIRADVARLTRELARFRSTRAVQDLQPLLAGALHP